MSLNDYKTKTNKANAMLKRINTTNAIILFILGIILMILGQNIIPLNQNILVTIFRPLSILFSPILIFTAYIIMLYVLLYPKLSKEPNLKYFQKIGIVGGLVSIELALIINTRVFLDMYLLFGILTSWMNMTKEQFTKLYFFLGYSVFPPLIEETGKIITLFILTRALISTKNSGKEIRAINNPGTLVFMATIIGSIFTLLEIYLYTLLNTGLSIFEIFTQKYWNYFLLQLTIRSFVPLHVFTTVIMAYGLNLTIYNSASNTIPIKKYTPFLLTYIVAILFHGTWNYFATFSGPWEKGFLSTFNLLGYEIPVMFIFLGLLGWSLFAFIILQTRNFNEHICEICGNWHSPKLKLEDHVKLPILSYSFMYSFIHPRRKNPNNCLVCGAHLNKENYCDNCGATMVYTCPICGNVVSPYAGECWYCGIILSPAVESTIMYPETLTDTIAISYLRFNLISTIFSIFVFLITFKNLARNNQSMLFLSYILIISSSLFIANSWYSTEDTKGMSIAVARIFLSMFLILLFLFQFLITFLIAGALIEMYGTYNLLIAFVFEIPLIAIIAYLLNHLIINYHPLLFPPAPLAQENTPSEVL